MDKQAHRSTSKDAYRSTYMDDQGNNYMDVSTDITGVHGSTCSEISNKGVGVHRGMSMDVSTGKIFVRVSMCIYDKYRVHGPIWETVGPGMNNIGTDTVGKVWKGGI